MPLDNQQELFFWVDEDDKVLGKITRYEAHHDRQKIHRAIDIVITNSQDQLLLQKRSQEKDTNPGQWASGAGGHVTYLDSYEETSLKELHEELGIEIPLSYYGKFLMRLRAEQEYCAIYLGKYESLPTTFDRDEIDEVKWVSKPQLKEMFKQATLTPMTIQIFQILGYL